MGLTEDGDETMERRYGELCLDLNLDSETKEEAWDAYLRISTNYTLEGDGIHWLACALYVSCRLRVVPTVGRGLLEGNCVSLTRLLRSAKLSLIEFFNKMKNWADMANLPKQFRDQNDRLEKSFNVSTVIFKKYYPIFCDIFRDPATNSTKPPRSRKQSRRLPCTPLEVFNFCWTMFVQVKGNFPAISDDLVNSYHLLLCCIDWFYANAFLSQRRDLLNPDFSGLPKNFHSKDYKAPGSVPCIITLLCDKHEGLHVEAKCIKEHWWKPYIKKLFEKKVLKGKIENVSGILEIGQFEYNSKSINHAYEEYVLNHGDFDERIFLEKDANAEIGTPAKVGSSIVGELSERMQVAQNLSNKFGDTMTPSTPLTGRRYLKEKEAPVTPVSTATQSVSRLQALLSGRKTLPSETLLDIFSECARDPKDDIISRVQELGDVFCTKYAQPSENHPGSHVDFAKKRLQLAESLYFKTLENIVLNERHRPQFRDVKTCDFSNLLEQDIFHRSLFACCLEIVIFSYNSQRVFPWVVDIFEVPAYYFYKVIELLIRAEDGLSRDVVKHLNHIEETILESLAWKSESPLWEAIKQQNLEIPSIEDVSLPNQIERDLDNNNKPLTVKTSTNSPLNSPIQHPAVLRIAGDNKLIPIKKDLTQSPTGPTLSDRFSSPMPGSAKRRLFDSSAAPPSSSISTTLSVQTQPKMVPASPGRENSGRTTPNSSAPATLVTYQQATTGDGQRVLIPVQLVQTGQKTESGSEGSNSLQTSSQQSSKPKRTGSLALFFRKVYHLASVRLRDLCERLDVDVELRSQMWTCFVHCMVNHVEFMQDRHLDQLLMCAIYVMAKVTGKDQSFQNIMRCYRLQPQAQSHVYRSVLLSSRRRRTSGSSTGSSRNGASGSNSPTNTEREDKRRAEKLSSLIRSSSTLPVPQPNSQPPTPTRLAGTGSTFEFEDRGEDRGDLIKFYNSVYLDSMKNFVLKFSAHSQEKGEGMPVLSPLPLVRPHHQSPRRVSSKHPVYLSPIKSRTITPSTKLLYCFNRSPSKDLRAINTMLRMGDKPQIAGKRCLPLSEDAAEAPPVKQQCASSSPIFSGRLEKVMADRREFTSNNSQHSS